MSAAVNTPSQTKGMVLFILLHNYTTVPPFTNCFPDRTIC